jgi:hypothetical protein
MTNAIGKLTGAPNIYRLRLIYLFKKIIFKELHEHKVKLLTKGPRRRQEGEAKWEQR